MAAISGKGNTFEQDILKLIFNATAIANIADNSATSPLTNLFVALHTADPLETGDQISSEANYSGYARIPVARTSGGWTVNAAGNPTTVQNANTITFGACTSGSNTITHATIGIAASGSSKILYGGALTSSLAVSNGIAPSFAAGALVVAED